MEKTKLKNALLFLYVGFFLISASLVMLQILYIRTLSVAMGLRFEFIIIPLVILGIGLGGILVFFLLNNIKSLNRVNSHLIISSLIYVVSIPIPFLLIKNVNDSSIFLFFISGFFTYFLGGIVTSLLFRYYVKKISKLYFLSLLGSAFGALGIIVSLEFFGMPKSISFLIILSSFSILFYALRARSSKKLIVSVITLIFAIFVFALNSLDYFQIACSNMGMSPITTKSDALFQVDTYRIEGESYDHLIVVDCYLTIPLINYNTTDEGIIRRKDGRPYVPFPFPTDNISSALMIGTAGGRSVIQAVNAGIPSITAVEINPLTVEGTEFLEKSDNIYYHDSVELFVEEGRAFVSNSKDKYDLIYVLGLRFGRAGYGAHLITENYLYTKEAVDSYFEHLNEDGILVIGVKEILLPRIKETVALSLLEKGIDPTKRIISFGETFLRGRMRGVTLIKNSDFSKVEVDNIIKKAVELELDASLFTETDLERYENGRSMTDNHPYLIEDDYPYLLGEKKFSGVLKYTSLLFLVIVLAYFLTALIPFYKFKNLRSHNVVYLLGFFSAIGIGFITLELSFIHKFTLFLGHPMLSFSVTLASVLFFGGLGSLLTGRFSERDIPRNIARIILPLILVVILFILSINFVLSKLIFLDTVYKIIFAISVLAIPSLLMGMIFPLGLKIAGRTSKKIIPWMVGIDGITSVLGGILSFMISLTLGLNAALAFGVIVYAFALFMVLKIK